MESIDIRLRSLLRGALRLVTAVLAPLVVVCALAPSVALAAPAPVVLVSKGAAGLVTDGPSINARVSASGRYVVFESDASNLVPGDSSDGFTDVFIRDMQTGATTLVSATRTTSSRFPNGASSTPAISADGNRVVFFSKATDLLAAPTSSGGIYLWERGTGAMTRVDVTPTGLPVDRPAFAYPSISGDGLHVAFASFATNLVEGDTNRKMDIFVRDLVTGGATWLVSRSATGLADGNSYAPSISSDGKRIAFSSEAANLVDGDFNLSRDVFVRDLRSGVATLSILSVGASGPADGASDWPVISADGNHVAFVSRATNLTGVPVHTQQVYHRVVNGSVTTCVSVSSDEQVRNAAASNPAISADGAYISFESDTDAVTGSAGGVFLRDRDAGATARVTTGIVGGIGLVGSAYPPGTGPYTSLSADGRFVAFESSVESLTSGEVNGQRDVFLRDMRPPVKAYLSITRISPDYVRRNAYFYVYGKVSKHSAKSSVRVYFYRKVTVKGVSSYRYYKYVTGSLASAATSFKLRYRLPYVGNWQVKVRHLPDTWHLDTLSTAKGFRVH